MKNIYHIDKKITKNDEITDRTWISIEEPTAEDKKFLLEDLKIPAAFITISKILMNARELK